jgi:hypothetical protein
MAIMTENIVIVPYLGKCQVVAEYGPWSFPFKYVATQKIFIFPPH